jgi:hypothetical protein
MLANLAIKIVEKLFDKAMEERDDGNVLQAMREKMLTNRARLTSTDELILSWIERNSPLTFDSLFVKFPNADCLAKRVTILTAYGFCTMSNGIIEITEEYKPLADKIASSSLDETIIQIKDN